MRTHKSEGHSRVPFGDPHNTIGHQCHGYLDQEIISPALLRPRGQSAIAQSALKLLISIGNSSRLLLRDYGDGSKVVRDFVDQSPPRGVGPMQEDGTNLDRTQHSSAM